MFGGLTGLTFLQKAYLEMCMLSCILLPIMVLKLTDDALITTLLYQFFCLFCFPGLYIKYFSKEKGLTPYFLSEFRNKGFFFCLLFHFKIREAVNGRFNRNGNQLNDCSLLLFVNLRV